MMDSLGMSSDQLAMSLPKDAKSPKNKGSMEGTNSQIAMAAPLASLKPKPLILSNSSPLNSDRNEKPGSGPDLSENEFGNHPNDMVEESGTPFYDMNHILVEKLSTLREPMHEICSQIDQEKSSIESLKARRSKLKSFLLSIYTKLLKNPVEAL